MANKFDHQGRSLLDIENERIDKETFFHEMIKDIDSTVKLSNEQGTLIKQKFYFIHFNYLCEVSLQFNVICLTYF